MTLISHRANLLALAVIAVFLAGALIQSAVRPFWNDEYFTLLIAQQPTLHEAMSALRKGIDLNPPLFHLATRLSTQALGLNRVGLRVPAVIGFAVMMFGLFSFVKRALPGDPGRICALIAMVIPVTTGMEYYASEGRAYGLMLGFLSLALLFWQSSQDSWIRSSLCGVMFGCAILTHTFVVFALGALILAELIRCYLFRAWNWRFGIVLAFALAAFGIGFEHIHKGSSVNVNNSYGYNIWSIAPFYGILIEPFSLELMLLLMIIAVVTFLPESTVPGHTEVRLAPAYVALAMALLLLPFVIVPICVFAKMVFPFRYSIASGVGFALMAAWLLFIGHRWRPALLPLCFALIFLSFAIHEVRVLARFARNPHPYPDRPSFDDPEAKTLPVYAQDPYLYIEMLFTWPEEKSANLHYVLDFKQAAKFIGGDLTEMNIAQMLPVKKLQVETYAELRSHRHQFLLYFDTAINRDEIKGWLLKKLLDDETPVHLLRRHGDIFVYLVTIPGPIPSPLP